MKDSLKLIKEFSKDLDLVVLDEAHNIKNSETLKSKAVKFISKRTSYKWALSLGRLCKTTYLIYSLYTSF